jgi:hypothetical protein
LRWATKLVSACLLAELLVAFPSSGFESPNIFFPTVNASGVEPGIVRLRANQVWPYFQGEGITIAILGPGVDFQHPALARQYRGRQPSGSVSHDYNWADFYGAEPYPTDPTGNGTFYAALALGDDSVGNQVGVAPAARWIAVRAVTPEQRHDAFRWLLAPCRVDGTACDPGKAPQVVLGAFYDIDPSMMGEFREDIDALHRAGIITVFAVGNAHQGACGSALPPGTLDITLGVGAVDASDRVAEWSGRGPSSGTIKPDLVAPGVEVRSAWTGSSYATRSSTVASAAYVAGILALLKEANPSLTPDQAYTLLRNTADGIPDWCGSGGPAVPNNVYGWGIPNALRAITSTATTGRLEITATSSGGLSLAGASVVVTNEADFEESSLTLGSNGYGALPLPPGNYTVSIQDSRHYRATVQHVAVSLLTGGSVSIALQELPIFEISGQLVDEDGQPVPGKIEFEGPDAKAVIADTQGRFSARMHEGQYTYRAGYPGRLSAQGQLHLTGDLTLSITLVASERILILHHGGSDIVSLLEAAAQVRGLEPHVVDGSSNVLPSSDEISEYRYVVWLSGSDVLERASELSDLLQAGGGIAVLSEDLGTQAFLDSDLALALGVAGYYPDLSVHNTMTVTLPKLAAQGPYRVVDGSGPDGWVVADGAITAAVGYGSVLGVVTDGPGRSLLLGISPDRFADSQAASYLTDRVLAWITGLPNRRIIAPLLPDVVPDGGGIRFIVDLPFEPSGWREIRAANVFSVTRSRRVFGFRAVDGVWPQDPGPISLGWTFNPRRAVELYLWGKRGDGSTVFLGAMSGFSFSPGVPKLLDAVSGGPAVAPVRALADRGLTELPAGAGVGTYGFGQQLSPYQMAFALVRAHGWLPPPGQNYLEVSRQLGIYSGPSDVALSRADVLVAIYRAMRLADFWRDDVVPVDPPSTTYCPRRPGTCTVRLYPGLQSAGAEVRQSVATYLHYVGSVPGTEPRLHPEDPLQWAMPADKGWFAQVLWKALRHRESLRGRPLPIW